jgi:hypothetical protein
VRLFLPRLARLVCLLWLAYGIYPAGISNGAEGESKPRLLVIDYGLASPQVHGNMARLFTAAGYAVDLRPDYPRLVKEDLRASPGGYRAIMLLAGNTPEWPGSMLTLRALEPLADFVRGGGVLFLGAPVNMTGGLAGENERTLFNRLLRRLGIRITIEKGLVEDQDDAYADTLYDAPWLYAARTTPLLDGLSDRLQLPRAAPLTVGTGAAVLVQTSPTAVIDVHRDANRDADGAGASPSDHHTDRAAWPIPVLALAAKGRGLVVVGARDLFNPTGAYQVDTPLLMNEDLRTARRQLVERLARYTIDWLHRTVAWRPGPAGLTGDGDTVATLPYAQGDRPSFWRTDRLLRRVPAGVRTIQFTDGGDGDASSPASPQSAREARLRWLRTLPKPFRWLTEQGIRAGWVYIDRDASFQRAVRNALIAGRLNLLWGSTDAELLAMEGHEFQKRELMAQWDRMDRLLRGIPGSKIRWFMGSHYPGAHAALSTYPAAVGAEGQTIGGMSPLDSRFWEAEIFPVLRAEAVFSLRHPSVGGVLIDLEMYPMQSWYFTNGFDFSDLAFDCYVRELERRGLADDAIQARGVPQAGRFDWLLDRGRWADYRSVLEMEAERIGRRLRETVKTVNPKLMIGFYAATMPTSWFYSGLLRGVGEDGQPVLLLTFQHAQNEELNGAFQRGIRLVHGAAILLGQVRLDELREAIQERLAFDDGYWLNNFATLATADPGIHHRSVIESPRDGRPANYLQVIAEANRSFTRDNRPPQDGGQATLSSPADSDRIGGKSPSALPSK